MRPVGRVVIVSSLLFGSMLFCFRHTSVFAQTCTGTQAPVDGSGNYLNPNTTLHVNITDTALDAKQLSDVQAGIKAWAGTSGLSIVFDNSPPGSLYTVTVQAGSGFSSASQGGSTTGGTQNGVQLPANQITGGTINLQLGYMQVCSGGTPCNTYLENYPNADYMLQHLLAHEMGHVLGLGDAVAPTAGCSAQTTSVMGGTCGTNNLGDGTSGSSQSSNYPTSCDMTTVSGERALYGPTSGGGGGTPPPNPPACCAGCCCALPPGDDATASGVHSNNRCTPILFDISGRGFHLTDTDGGVKFDIFADGTPKQIPWTSSSSDNAWLVLDRNGNGLIDNSTELFGNLTPQAASRDPNGFRALAEFDKPENGGNSDGLINRHDAVFTKLRLWVDRNHNGISEPSELVTLQSAGIEAIDLTYREILRKDEYGNLYRYKGSISDDEHKNVKSCYDVILITNK